MLNGPLREVGRTAPHPLPVTVSFLAEAIGKLRAVGAKTPQANRQLDMWRGMKDLDTSDEFDQRGGTELAPMSTTTQLKVALTSAPSTVDPRTGRRCAWVDTVRIGTLNGGCLTLPLGCLANYCALL